MTEFPPIPELSSNDCPEDWRTKIKKWWREHGEPELLTTWDEVFNEIEAIKPCVENAGEIAHCSPSNREDEKNQVKKLVAALEGLSGITFERILCAAFPRADDDWRTCSADLMRERHRIGSALEAGATKRLQKLSKKSESRLPGLEAEKKRMLVLYGLDAYLKMGFKEVSTGDGGLLFEWLSFVRRLTSFEVFDVMSTLRSLIGDRAKIEKYVEAQRSEILAVKPPSPDS